MRPRHHGKTAAGDKKPLVSEHTTLPDSMLTGFLHNLRAFPSRNVDTSGMSQAVTMTKITSPFSTTTTTAIISGTLALCPFAAKTLSPPPTTVLATALSYNPHCGQPVNFEAANATLQSGCLTDGRNRFQGENGSLFLRFSPRVWETPTTRYLRIITPKSSGLVS